MTTIKVGNKDAEGFHPDGSIVDPDAVDEYLAPKFNAKANASSLAAKLDKTEAATTYANQHDIAPGVPLVNPRGLRRWHAALGEALFTPVSISVLGDSISVGVGADGNPSGGPSLAHDDVVRPRGWVGQLRSLFTGTYGDSGPGWLSPPDNGQRFTAAGGALYATYGPYEQGFRVAGSSQTVTAVISESFTELDIYTWDGGSGNYTVTVDGGAAQTFNAGTGNVALRTWTKQTITGLANTGHTIVFTGPSTGSTAYFAGIVARKQNKGVLVHRMAKSGNTTNNVLGLDSVNNANTEAKARSLVGIGLVPKSALVIVPLGVNDHGNQANTDVATQSQPGTTPTQYEANLRAIANQAVTNGSSVLLLGEPRRPTPTGTYSEQEYWDRAKKIAQDTDHVSFLDINSVWGSNTLGNQLGYYTAASVHPSLKGHGSMALTVYRPLIQQLGFNAPIN